MGVTCRSVATVAVRRAARRRRRSGHPPVLLKSSCCCVEERWNRPLVMQQKRYQSDNSSGRSNSSSGTLSSTPPKRSGPIRLQQTPRAAARKRPTVAAVASDDSDNTQQQQQPLPDAAHAHILWTGGVPSECPPPTYHLADSGEESLYTLVLLRHGESEWNQQNRYTGWCDVSLTERGVTEAKTAGRLLAENGLEIDHAFTSVLQRAAHSLHWVLDSAADQHWVPVTKTWRLNERHYGALQGYNKDTAYEELGLDQELVMQMRRAYHVRPPRMEDDHPYWHGNERRYRKLAPEQIERSRAESLKDAAARIMPFFHSVMVPSMRAGNKCLVVSHANTIRTLVKQIDNISDEDIKGMTIPTGIPLLYRLDKNMKPVDPQIELEFRYLVEPKGYTWGTSRAHGFHGVYLGDVERLQEIQQKRDRTNRDWQRIILRNIGKSLGWDMDDEADFGSCSTKSTSCSSKVLETRQLWWQIHSKMQASEYSNMLLLAKMEDALEELMYQRKQKYITQSKYEEMVNQLHLDTEGSVVEPFVALADQEDRAERERAWYDNLALEMEEECLIK